MKYKWFSLIILLMSLSIQAEQPIAATNEVIDNKKIHDVFAKYMTGYNYYITHKSMQKPQALYTDPMMLITPNRPPAMLNELKLQKGIKPFLDNLIAKGVVKIAWQDIRIKMLGKTVAIASNTALRYKKNGDVFDRAAATYLLKKDSEQWKIAAFTPHAPENVLQLN